MAPHTAKASVVEISDLDLDLEKKRFLHEPDTKGLLVSQEADANRPLVSMRYLSMAVFVLHNSILVLTMHYSRIAPQASGHRYLPSTAVLLVEVIKLITSLSVSYHQTSVELGGLATTSEKLRHLRHTVFSSDCWKLAVPAGLWTLQNSILYVAISNLDAATFQVTYQLKILATVLCSILLLGTRINAKQWFALVLLTLGVIIVQFSDAIFDIGPLISDIQTRLLTILRPHSGILGPVLDTAEDITSGKGSTAAKVLKRAEPIMAMKKGHAHSTISTMNPAHGLIAVLAACLISSITGVYFEKVLKNSHSTLWTRNVQLSFFSLFPALFIGVWWQDGKQIAEYGFFVGYNSLVWTIIILQSLGGIIVAFCIKYADNIAKNFAASLSLLCTCLASAFLFDTPLTTNFALGTIVVLFASYLYHENR